MAVTQNSFTGNGSTTNFSFTFPYIKQADVKAKIDGVNTTAFTLANATTVSFTSAPASGAAIIIFRDTDNDEKTATFFAGSAVKAEDLNSNFDQVLFTAQEVDNNALQTLGGTMSGDLNFGQNANIVFEGATDDANETTLTVADPTADRTITLPNVTGTVITTGDTGTVATGMIADSAITSAKISDGTIATGDIANDAITTAKISDANVTTALIADANVTTAKLASNAVTTAKITDANVTTAKLAADCITGAKIADDVVDSEHFVAGSIDTEHLSTNSVTTDKITDANVTTVKVADAAITTAKLNDGAVTTAKIGSTQVTSAKIADGNITTVKIADSGVTTAKIADNAVTTAKLADAELTELATMGSTTASALADLTQAEVRILDGATVTTDELNILDGVTADATEINQLDGNTLTNSFTASSTTQYPSSNAISGYVLGLMDNLGGFVAIANENSFPTTNPDPSDDAGTVVSISDAGGLVVSASGTASGQTTGGVTVTITGFPSALQSSTLPAGQGLQVVSTSTLNTYTYHKVLGTDADIAQLNDDVNDFFARYRIGSTNPTTDLDAGDLFFNTSTGKMLVYDATNTAWEEVQAVGNYFINTLSSSSGTGGGSATFNGTAYRFELSNPGSVAQQHIVSINGVIQKPNSGTTQPSEGFAIDNADIILAAAPATGADFFIVTVGTSVNIGAPSNDTINNAMVKADAAIAGTKISPDFGSQNVVTTGSVGIGTASPVANTPLTLQGPSGYTDTLWLKSIGTNIDSRINFGPTGTGIAQINNATGTDIAFQVSGSEKLRIDSAGHVGIGRTPFTSAGYPLQIRGNSQAYLSLSTSSQGDTALDGLVIGTDNSSAYIFQRENAPLSFWTNDTERMRIDSSGNVGIGTGSSIDELFHMQTSSATARLKIESTTADSYPGVRLTNPGRTYDLQIVSTSGDFRIFDSTGSSERMRIDTSGNLLVGLTSAVGIGGTPADSNSTEIGRGYINISRDDTQAADHILFGKNGSIASSIGTSTTNSLTFKTGTTERMRIDSGGNLGLGTTSPSTRLEVVGNTTPQLKVGMANDADRASLMHNGSDLYLGTTAGSLIFRTASNTERMRIQSAGGISFNGDTAAANALDDYEEGDFTPSWGLGLTSPSYVTQSGKYTKIGRTVYFTLQLSTNGGTPNSSAARIDGFPFNAIGTSVTGGAFVNYFAGWGIDTPFFYKNQSDATMSIYAQSTGSALPGNAGSGIDNVNLYIMGFYHVS